MIKKKPEEIKNYYLKSKVVKAYEDKRFKGFGGKYINEVEVGLIIKTLSTIKLKNKTILDLGAGKGRLSIPLKEAGYFVYCLDSSPEMIRELKNYFPQKNLILQSAFEPFEQLKYIGVIVSLRFFDHFNLANQKKILENSKKVLGKDGVIVFSCLNKFCLESLIARFFPYGNFNYYYSANKYEKLFRNLELNVISKNSGFFLPRGIFLHLLFLNSFFISIDKLLSKIFPNFNNYFVYLLKKN